MAFWKIQWCFLWMIFPARHLLLYNPGFPLATLRHGWWHIGGSQVSNGRSAWDSWPSWGNPCFRRILGVARHPDRAPFRCSSNGKLMWAETIYRNHLEKWNRTGWKMSLENLGMSTSKILVNHTNWEPKKQPKCCKISNIKLTILSDHIRSCVAVALSLGIARFHRLLCGWSQDRNLHADLLLKCIQDRQRQCRGVRGWMVTMAGRFSGSNYIMFFCWFKWIN